MATPVKFEDYTEQLLGANHDWVNDTFKLMLTNTAPTAATGEDAADITEISAGGGYTAGGQTLDSVTVTRSGGVAKVTIADEVITATSGGIATFRYLVIINSTADLLVLYYDHGSAVTLAEGDTHTTDFDGSAGFATLT
jgi:hypothetical protein